MSIIIVIFAVVQILRLLLSYDSTAKVEGSQLVVADQPSKPDYIPPVDIIWDQYGLGSINDLAIVSNIQLSLPEATNSIGIEVDSAKLYWSLTISQQYFFGEKLTFTGCNN